MTGNIARVAAITFEIGSLAGLGYYLACLWSARSYLRDRMEMRAAEEEAPAPNLPPVSILKPLKGEDPEIYASFRTHCLQNHPEYEIVFGVSDPNDPALEAVERLRQEFPAQAIQVIVCREVLGANTKVSNLAQMLKAARYQTLVVSDSDIRVPRDYLCRVIAPLEDEKVGMVTCLYRGISGDTLGSRLESLGISTDWANGFRNLASRFAYPMSWSTRFFPPTIGKGSLNISCAGPGVCATPGLGAISG